MQALSSPWDVVLYTTPDMDMSVRALPPPPPPPGRLAEPDVPKPEAKGKLTRLLSDSKKTMFYVLNSRPKLD
jgi:hypothetical protein